MKDNDILALYEARREEAIAATAERYGAYCRTIARRILQNEQDAEECVSDTYRRAWSSIPPHRPENLATYLGKITRNLALNRLRSDRAVKRGTELGSVLDELKDVIPDPETTADPADALALKECLDRFLASLPSRSRAVFLRRYWHLQPVAVIAAEMGLSVSNVKITLMRTRTKLKNHLEKEGFPL